MPKKKKTWQPSESAAGNAKLVLPSLASQFFRAGRKAVESKLQPEQLHPFRIKTKRFRYTLELFRPCYGAGLEQKLAGLRKIQQYLGDISDCVTTQGLLDQSELHDPNDSFDAPEFLQSRIEQKAEEFRRYWIETIDRSGQERQWTDYLRRFAGRGSKTRRK
jgi:CHAD domain-containing protein